MGFYVRYYMTDSADLSLAQLQTGLKDYDPAYRLPHEGDAGELHYGEELYAEAEINRPGEELFDEEIAETIESVEAEGGAGAADVAAALRDTKRTVVLRILWQGRDPEQTLSKIDPVIAWLTLNREGLLQVDGEGFYEGDELILEME